MSDASLIWGGDLLPNPVGDLETVDKSTLGQQRVLRRLLTNPGDYIWQPAYGAGLGQYVGSPASADAIRATIRSQIFLESIVARLPEPVISVAQQRNGSLYIDIRYVDAANGNTQVLTFSVGG